VAESLEWNRKCKGHLQLIRPNPKSFLGLGRQLLGIPISKVYLFFVHEDPESFICYFSLQLIQTFCGKGILF